MPARPALLILPLLALPALAACGKQAEAPVVPPLSAAALAAVNEKPGVPREKLARAIDDLFADRESGETRALLILRGGKVVAERYGPGFGPDSRLLGWSMTKSITGALIGLLVADGRLRLDESAPVPAWQRPGDPRGEITLRQLLQMRAGLRHTENGDPVYKSDEVRMLFLDGRDNMAAYAEAQPLEARPGREFEYSSAAYVILSDIAGRAITESEDPVTRRKAVSDYLRARLFEPLGMRSMMPEFDAAGTFAGSSLVHGTARDWARFGEFLRNGGSVKGAQIVPHGWVEFMTAPSPRNPGYGASVWLNRENGQGRQLLFPGRAPATAFACIGHFGQYVIVSPAQGLTVVRLGQTPSANREHLAGRMGDIVALFPRN